MDCVFTEDKTVVLSNLREEFDRCAYPYFDKQERAMIGSVKDGEYSLHFSGPSGLVYNGIIEIHGYNVRWFFSTRFRYRNESDDKDQGTCYALFYQGEIEVLTSHSLWRYNERVLNNQEKSADQIFHKHIERMMDYASYTKCHQNKGYSLFVRVDGGAFLSYVNLKDNHWCKTFISDEMMRKDQVDIADGIDLIDSFQAYSGIKLNQIMDSGYHDSVSAWIEGSYSRLKEYHRVLESVRTVYQYYEDGELDEQEWIIFKHLERECDRVRDLITSSNNQM